MICRTNGTYSSLTPPLPSLLSCMCSLHTPSHIHICKSTQPYLICTQICTFQYWMPIMIQLKTVYIVLRWKLHLCSNALCDTTNSDCQVVFSGGISESIWSIHNWLVYFNIIDVVWCWFSVKAPTFTLLAEFYLSIYAFIWYQAMKLPWSNDRAHHRSPGTWADQCLVVNVVRRWQLHNIVHAWAYMS